MGCLLDVYHAAIAIGSEKWSMSSFSEGVGCVGVTTGVGGAADSVSLRSFLTGSLGGSEPLFDVAQGLGFLVCRQEGCDIQGLSCQIESAGDWNAIEVSDCHREL